MNDLIKEGRGVGRLKSMNHKSTEVQGRPELTFKDFAILMIFGIFIFGSIGISDVFEMYVEWPGKYGVGGIGELAVVSSTLAFAFGIFALRRWREVRRAMAGLRLLADSIKDTSVVLPQEMGETEPVHWKPPRDLDVPARDISKIAGAIIRKYGESMDADIKDRLMRIQRNGERELGLIRDPIELSRIKAKIERFDKVDAGGLGKGCIDELPQALKGRKVGFSVLRAVVEAFGGEFWVESPSKDPCEAKRAEGGTSYSKLANGALKRRDK